MSRPYTERELDEMEQEIATLREKLEEFESNTRRLREALDCVPAEVMLIGGPPYTVTFSKAALQQIASALAVPVQESATERRYKALVEHSWRVVHLASHKDGAWHIWGQLGEYGPRIGCGNTPEEAIEDALRSQNP